MYGITRTGVRFVLSNSADPARAADASAWYDTYTAAITGPGMLANVFRLENPEAAETGQDARFAAVYDIVSPDPAAAWPATESSTSYPKDLFDDPRAALNTLGTISRTMAIIMPGSDLSQPASPTSAS